MSVEEFFSAMESVFIRMYPTGDSYGNVNEYLSSAEAALK